MVDRDVLTYCLYSKKIIVMESCPLLLFGLTHTLVSLVSMFSGLSLILYMITY